MRQTNGANPAQGFYYEGDSAFWQQFDNSYENLGRKNSFVSAGPHWANVSNAPYANIHKTTSAQGGINTDLIITGPGINKAGSIDNTPMAVYDIAPTLYEFAGIDPNKKIKDISPVPVRGVSFKQHFTQGTPVKTRYSFAMELHNQAALVEGNWKLRRLVPTSAKAEMAPWELFNLKDDPLETQNLAAQYPDILEKLRQQYEQFAKTGMVIEAKGEAIDYIGYNEKTGNYLGIDPETHKRIVPTLTQSGE
ncbi:Arylsulfatase precursor [Providencia rettgeri]|uniref:Arylsulfatase n=1 Tax=Providencia rettgeri TaxID=587 RepID=A0A379FXF0_PRORE|nr:Arylsulfatase precursor [Providencia rettgeri]